MEEYEIEKTEMMKKYESETGLDAMENLLTEDMKIYAPTQEYIDYIEAKAEVCDNLMAISPELYRKYANR